MAKFITTIGFALFLAVSYVQGAPMVESQTESATFIDGVVGAGDEKTVEERSASPGAPPPPPPQNYGEGSTYAQSYGGYENVANRWAVIHTCWKSYPTVRDVYKSISNALVVGGKSVADLKEGEIKLAIVTVKNKGKSYAVRPYGRRYARNSYKQNDVIEYVDILKTAVSTVDEASSLSHLAWLWAYAIWKEVKPQVVDVLCLTVVTELNLQEMTQYESSGYGPQ